jgi:hypothetical protein
VKAGVFFLLAGNTDGTRMPDADFHNTISRTETQIWLRENQANKLKPTRRENAAGIHSFI